MEPMTFKLWHVVAAAVGSFNVGVIFGAWWCLRDDQQRKKEMDEMGIEKWLEKREER